MSESTKVTKSESEKSRSFMGVRRNFSRGGNVDILFIIFKLLTISVPSKIILHWANIYFSEHDYFKDEQVEFSINYKLCELYNKHTFSSNYEQNNILFKQLLVCVLFHCIAMLQVRENEISLRNSSGGPEYLRTSEGTLLTMQCKWTTNRFILSTLQRKFLMSR